MKRKTILITCLVIAILTMVPFTSMATPQPEEQKTTTILIKLGNEKFERELPLDTIEMLVEMGVKNMDNFTTIYNKKATPGEVAQAFENVQPFFEALVENGISESVNKLNTLFNNIRSKVRKPIRPQTTGMMNGIPTPIFCNSCCGVTSGGMATGGIWIGTHTILPTLGIDLFGAWFGGTFCETASVGLLGWTTSTGPQANIVLGFFGLYIGVPAVIVGPYFLSGFAPGYIGASPAPI